MIFTRNEKKNEWLKNKRWRNGISFDKITKAILNGWLVDIRNHENQDIYPWQQVFYVNLNNYIYRVPYTLKWNKVYLITFHSSRKATKFYLWI